MTVLGNDTKSIGERLAEFKRAMTAEEVAALFRIHTDTIYKQARRGDIPSFRIGTDVQFDPKVFVDWLDHQTIDPHGELEKLRKAQAVKR